VSGTDTLLARLRTRFNALQDRLEPDSPGASRYYGTDSGGTKGFYVLPSSGTPTGDASPTTPPTTGWTAVNDTGCTFAANSAGTMVLTAPTSSGQNVRVEARALPHASSDFTVIAQVRTLGAASGNGWIGIGFRESSTGKLVFISLWKTGSVVVTRYTNPTTFAADYTNIHGTSNAWVGKRMWLKIARSGANRTFSISANGIDWQQVISQSWTLDFTPDQVFFGLNVLNANLGDIGELLSWQETV
jgi:hypothetical protein